MPHDLPGCSPGPQEAISPRKVQEIADRLRRIETRLTRFMDASGFDTETKKPSFHAANHDRGAYVSVPSQACAFDSILACLPERAEQPRYPVMLKNELIGWVSR
jgi:hypothetical protein